MSDPDYFDVCILGSGLAGSLTALILAKSGKRVALIDRTGHPRFSIGESSTPAADYLLESLCHRYQLQQLLPLCRFGSWQANYPQLRCGCKRGFSYVWHGQGSEYRPTPSHDCELLVTASASALVADTQWYRPDVDQFLYTVAMEHGAVPLVPYELTDVARQANASGEQWRLILQSQAQAKSVVCEWLVDASGPNSFLMNRLGVTDSTAQLRTNSSAIFTHIEHCGLAESWLRSRGAKVDDFPFPIDQAAVHHLFNDGWLWQIGFVGSLTSVGFVFANQAGPNGDSNDAAKFDAARLWHQLLNSKPVLREVIAAGTLAKLPGKILGTNRVQHLRSTSSGEGWVALPFTYGFIDPLHSTGIAHSLSGVARICQALLEQSPEVCLKALNRYSQQLEHELWLVDLIVAGCYQALRDFQLFSCWTMIYFAAATTYERRHRQHQVTGFLLAEDKDFCEITELLYRELVHLTVSNNSLSCQQVEGYCRRVQELIKPFNQVGLFAPPLPNLYWHTAAEK